MFALLVAAGGDDGFGSLITNPRFGAMVWTWIAFLAAMPVMWKFVYGPITSALEARDTKVEDAIRAADSAGKAAEEQVAAAVRELEQARSEARTMVQKATQRAQRQADEALANAKEEAKRQLEKARQDIRAEKGRALAELRQEVVNLTIAATGRLLGREVDDDANRKMVEGFVEDIRRN